MNEEVHKRAERLIAADRVEGIPPQEREWLDGHLEECARCAALAASTETALRALRTVPIRLSPTLAARTRLRLSLRDEELQQERARQWALWISCTLSWVVGVASAPFVWRAFEWLGREARLPSAVWQAGFAFWLLVPGVVAAAFLAARKRQAARMIP